ncbi:hypothetical protein [Streptococcus suis]|uniref:hypothetical protein n=1 Tax=Streptococcus suis TaxID=1307 RepID=UPI000CF58783|nr:hypothetical protein [Streptococcus suis]WNO77522.1 hypothetical protein RMP67_06630 [Streptococcus suis]WNO78528.1 hypothetical protein RMP67_00095 [Streptococcus suis]
MEIGICRHCGCNWITPCINESHGACWWIDDNRTLCSHCFYHFSDAPSQTKVYYRPGHDWLERDEEFAEEVLANPKSHWVYDMEYDVLCVVTLGDHIGAVRFIANKFYGLSRIYREEIPRWQEIIANNMIFHNAMVTDSDHYARHLPRKYREED